MLLENKKIKGKKCGEHGMGRGDCTNLFGHGDLG